MPPSTHYLNLLNLNQVEDQSLNVDYTHEDIAKELELFTNTNFLEFEPYYPQSQDQNVFDRQLSSMPFVPDVVHQERMKMQNPMVPQQNMGAQIQPLLETTLSIDPEGAKDKLSSKTVSRKRSVSTAKVDSSATPLSGSQVDEEDKRRRNTAASARFRIKKKQKEQALLESAKQMNDMNTALENRVKELEMENKWLRSLLKPVATEHAKNTL